MRKYPVDIFLALVLTIAFLMAIGNIETGSETMDRLLSILNNGVGIFIAINEFLSKNKD